MFSTFLNWLKNFFTRPAGPPPNTIIIHYRRRAGDYDGWGLHLWDNASYPTSWDNPLPPTGQDDYGIYWVAACHPDAQELPYIIHKGNEKDPGPNQLLSFEQNGRQVWLIQGRETQFHREAEALAAMEIHRQPAHHPQSGQIALHYHRPKEDYDGWGLYLWGPAAAAAPPHTWASPLFPDGYNAYGPYWLINLAENGTMLNYIIHKGDEKDPGRDQALDAQQGQEIYLIQGSEQRFADPESAKEAAFIAAIGDIRQRAQAHWLTRELIAWPTLNDPQARYSLHYDSAGGLKLTKNGVSGGSVVPLEWAGNELPPELAAHFPHLRHAALLKAPTQIPIAEMLKGQIVVQAIYDDPQRYPAATAVQTAGVLDDLYAANARRAALGVHWERSIPTLRVWAPTARAVSLRLYAGPGAEARQATVAMRLDAATGIWSVSGSPAWKDQYYQYEVEVFVRQEGRCMRNLVSDPYSLALSVNGERSQIANLDDYKPAGWDALRKKQLESPADMVIYELHVRDFSARDSSIPPAQRGTFLAFTQQESHGMRHLRRLAQAGLTHIHLMPVFDIATVNEDKSQWQSVDYATLAALPPDSEEQQAAVCAIREVDAFNWGYDPHHYTTPEGAYCVSPQGAARSHEFRQMVMGLHQAGLRVIMDVVYNHTYAGGQESKSILDRIVPGYYHRLDENGEIASSTCCANTASEHAMMEKLMLDSLRVWAMEYKVDGFRFDLMGHHMLRNMLNVRAMLDALTLEQDGVDGKGIYVYGEGWDFGEVAGNARGVNASQWNMGGSDIGSFNDRLRDAARGGNPFRDPREQGFLSGLFTDPNEADTWPESVRLAKLLELSDIVRASLAGNLADYPMVNAQGNWVIGRQILYNGQGAGYASSPTETVNYISAHDNETLFDSLQYKLPFHLSPHERARAQCLGIDLLLLGQGIPFCDAGIELLRSKSLDRDSFNSGDWFNYLDYTKQTNNWGVGMPPQDVNQAKWPLIKTMLGNPGLRIGPAEIAFTAQHFEEMLRLRQSSRLFRLRTAQETLQHLEFHNSGPGQIPGLIVMSLRDDSSAPVDPQYDWIITLFNARPDPVSFTLHELPDLPLRLHPIQAASTDERLRQASFEASSKTFTVPGRTTAVFVT